MLSQHDLISENYNEFSPHFKKLSKKQLNFEKYNKLPWTMAGTFEISFVKVHGVAYCILKVFSSF